MIFPKWILPFAVAVTLLSPAAIAQKVENVGPDDTFRSTKMITYPAILEEVDGGEPFGTIKSGVVVRASDCRFKNGDRARYLIFFLWFQPEKKATIRRHVLLVYEETDMVAQRFADLVRIAKSRTKNKEFDEETHFAPAEGLRLGLGPNDDKTGLVWSVSSGDAVFVSMSLEKLGKLSEQVRLAVEWLKKSKG